MEDLLISVELTKSITTLANWYNLAIREKLVYSYRVIYRVEAETITVVAVIHGKQLLNSEMKES